MAQANGPPIMGERKTARVDLEEERLRCIVSLLRRRREELAQMLRLDDDKSQLET